MTLPANSRLGPHEIVAQIGAGGMGEVYHARDTRPSRDVAIMGYLQGETLAHRLGKGPLPLSELQRSVK